MITCPFCPEFHNDSVSECPDKKIKIPPVYINEVKEGTPVVFVYTIGYRGYGKTCFFGSFFFTLYEGFISKIWPNFSFLGLNQETLNDIHSNYVIPLKQGYLPGATPVMFRTPLILLLQNIPLKVKGFRGLFKKGLEVKKIIFVFYDVGGETFEVDERIRENLPILNKVNTMVFLISLPKILEEDLQSAPQRLHNLFNTTFLALRGRTEEKNALLCFIWADEMWGKDNIYGPLAKKRSDNVPSIEEIPHYLYELKRHSFDIDIYIKNKYPAFYNADFDTP
ncbi:MAG: hypothetical protein AB1414_09715 [bacterium]